MDSIEKGASFLDRAANVAMFQNDKMVEIFTSEGIKPEPIQWLWEGWLARGKMHVLGGAPGTGKTTISLGLAATISMGGRWPDGTKSSVGSVVIWSGEDDPKDTLTPRLILSGADRSNIYFVKGTRVGNEFRPFDPANDVEALVDTINTIGDVRLLIIDPIVSAITGDSHKNAEVRRGLQPLADLASIANCAVLGITHFSKGTIGRDPVERLTGSLAFGALARIVMIAAKYQKEDKSGRMFCRAKSNIGVDFGGYEYDLTQAELENYPGVIGTSVLWGKQLEGSARDLLAEADAPDEERDAGALDEAQEFLRGLLSSGPVLAKEIKADVDGAGLSWTTIKRAKKAIGIKTRKAGMNKGWVWELSEGDQISRRGPSYFVGHLQAPSEHLRDDEEKETK